MCILDNSGGPTLCFAESHLMISTEFNSLSEDMHSDTVCLVVLRPKDVDIAFTTYQLVSYMVTGTICTLVSYSSYYIINALLCRQ